MGRTSRFEDEFRSNPSLSPYGSKELLTFAFSLRFGINDLRSLRAEAILDGRDDEKIDGLHIDEESGIAVIAQSYQKGEYKRKQMAKANKAKDLNTAASKALIVPLEELSETVRPVIDAFRKALLGKKIKRLEFWYVHNLDESEGIDKELRAVELSASNFLKAYGSVDVSAMEIGRTTLTQWYKELSPIYIPINKKFEIDIPSYYSMEGETWKAIVTSVPAIWLYTLFKQYGTKLFSANLRDYLGSIDKDKNINNGIKSTCIENPINFWVYNNGITCLVHSCKPNSKNNKMIIKGISIVNGAQTTGAIGSLDQEPPDTAMVPTRFVMCKNQETIRDIRRYNNSQNKIGPADFRSTDPIQRRLATDFKRIPNAIYKLRRGSDEDLIRRKARSNDVFEMEEVGKVLAAFHGQPSIAYHKKAKILWDNSLYSTFFNDALTPEHIVFAYALFRAIINKKRSLSELEKKDNLKDVEKIQLSVLRERGGIVLLVSAISSCLETVLDRPIPNKSRLSFGSVSLENGVKLWEPIIESTIPLCGGLAEVLGTGGIEEAKAKKAVEGFRSLVDSTKISNKQIFAKFKSSIK